MDADKNKDMENDTPMSTDQPLEGDSAKKDTSFYHDIGETPIDETEPPTRSKADEADLEWGNEE